MRSTSRTRVICDEIKHVGRITETIATIKPSQASQEIFTYRIKYTDRDEKKKIATHKRQEIKRQGIEYRMTYSYNSKKGTVCTGDRHR